MSDRDLITVGNYTSLPEVELAQGILDDAGIDSVLVDDNVGRMLAWTVVGGFKLQVNKEDADAALKRLSAPTSALPQNSAQHRCPNCDSADVVMEESASPAYTGASLLTPVEVHDKSWECKSCGYCWDSDAKK